MERDGPALGRRVLGEAAFVAVLFSLLYFFTQPHNLSSAHDSISYINKIESGEWFHPHHLLYKFTAAKWVSLWRLLKVRADTLALVQLLNICFGSLTLAVFYLILRTRFSVSSGFALMGTALAGFSFGFWFYSSVVEVYVIPLFFVALTFYLLTGGHPAWRRYFLIGATHGAAILFHQVHVLFFVVIAYVLLRAGRRNRGFVVRALGAYCVVVVPVVAVPYTLAAFAFHNLRSAQELWDWLTWYASAGIYWQSVAPVTFARVLIGFGNSIIGGHFAFRAPGLSGFLTRMLANKQLDDETYLVRHLGELEIWALLGACVLLGALLLVWGIHCLRFARAAWQWHERSLGPLLMWLGIYAVFFYFWEPSNLEFWIPQSYALWLILVSVVCHGVQRGRLSRRAVKVGFAAVAALLFIVNLRGSILWLRDFENDYHYVKARAVADLASEDDLLITWDRYVTKEYMQRFAGSEVLSLASVYSEQGGREQAVDWIRHEIDGTLARGGEVLVLGDAVDMNEAILPAKYAELPELAGELWRGYEQRWSRVELEMCTVYVLKRSWK